jgi:hypothetical protein
VLDVWLDRRSCGLPAVPDHVEPCAGQDAHGVGMVVSSLDVLVVEVAVPGLARRESPAKSQTMSRSCLSAAQRKPPMRCLPDCRVHGATPARHARDSGLGNRPRQSAIWLSSRAAGRVRGGW